jgi:16S rRNA (guanine(966)-N(2))-methyltransferase RsmD
MRVIGGKYRGRNLKSPPSLQVRPTSDRLRETLFNVLAPRIENARFLDLCAGSGAVGIEALSRGAAHITFVDRSRKMSALIASNLELCRISTAASTVVSAEAGDFLDRIIKQAPGPWHIVFFDPPYADDYLAVLERIGSHGEKLLTGDGLVIVEHDKRKLLPEIVGSLQQTRILKQGDSVLSFYEVSDPALARRNRPRNHTKHD